MRLLGVTLLASVAVGACSLPPFPPEGTGGAGVGGTGNTFCAAGSGGSNGGVDGSNNIDNIVTPIACNASNADLSIFKYSSGYTPDPDVQARVRTMISQMSLADKATQMRGMPPNSTDIQRSKDTSTIRGFRYRDASRGMNLGEDMEGTKPNAAKVNGSQVGFSTAFPVSMARGAAFDLDLEHDIGEAIGDEMQAANQTLLLAPCMNLLRNPLWGRAQETYGEDPFHIGRLASAMTVGAQEHIAASAKYFMGYDIENGRDFNDVAMDEQTLRERYGRHFRMVVQDGGVASVVASYNKVNGTESTFNRHTLTDVLRADFGFKGFVLSAWWAMPPEKQTGTNSATLKSYALNGMQAGLNVELPWALNYGQLENIVKSNGGLTEDDINASVALILEQKFRFNADPLTGGVGLGTPKTSYEESRIIYHCDGHIDLAKKAALESMVLLKNDKNTLPIGASVTKVAVLGATVPYKTTDGGSTNTGGSINFATDVVTGDLGSSRVFPDPAQSIGPFQGIHDGAPDGVTVVSGSSAADVPDADFIVVVAGLTPGDEGEEYTAAGDRTNGFGLDAKRADTNLQSNLITSVAALGKPMVVVLEAGSVVDMPWLGQVPAVVMAWYPGMRGGEALAELLWGQANFGGKLPFSWGHQVSDYEELKAAIGTTSFDYFVGYSRFDHYNISPLFPFGYGLSYTSFEYSKLQLGCSDMSKGAVLPVVVNVRNTGNMAGDEIVMVFVSYPSTKAMRRLIKELKGFARVSLNAGEEKQITIPVRLADLDYYDQVNEQWVVEDGPINIMVGGSSTNLPLSGTVYVNGY